MSGPTLKDPCELLDSLVDTFQPAADLTVINDIALQQRATEKIRTHQHDAIREQLKCKNLSWLQYPSADYPYININSVVA
jgi:hypothetical protein